LKNIKIDKKYKIKNKMDDINLVTKEEEKSAGSSAREWIACIVIIILSLLVYVGAVAYDRFLIKDVGRLNREYESQYNSLLESGKNVFDFQNRLETAKPLVLEKNYALGSLDQIEKMIIPGIYVESFTWSSEKGIVNLECVSSEYRLVANQLASFKKSDYFSEVIINETKSREDGKISFFLKLAIKNKK